MATARKRRAAGAAVGLAVLAWACAPPESRFDGRQAVGTTPPGFAARPVGSAAEAAAYVADYARELGIKGLAVRRVVSPGDRHLVYVAEEGSGRAAFSLEVSPEGAIRPNAFPAMEPEMMWNQKYGHRARLRESAVEMELGAGEAATRVREALAGRPDLGLGEAETGFGYYRFRLLGGEHAVGEAVVDAVGGGVVWGVFPEGTTVWAPVPGGAAR